MPYKSISILGCGWLGFPLAERLIALGFLVNGSTTTTEKVLPLKDAGINPFVIECTPAIAGGDVDSFLRTEVLFLNIPFKRDLEDPKFYKQQIDAVIDYVKKSSIRLMIFASSTSVYPEDIGDAREDVTFVPVTSRARVLYDVEQAILNTQKVRSTVVRFAGLYGGRRIIGRFMSGRKGQTKGLSPVNLIHLEDCVEILVKIIQNDVHGEIFNVCSDFHPTRKELYTRAAVAQGLTPPEFIDEEGVPGKVVNNEKLKQRLNYTFKYPDPSELV